MNTLRNITGMAIATALSAVLLIAATAKADVKITAGLNITAHPKEELQVWVWPDRGEGGTYTPGDDISVFVEANRDCFLILYNIDTRGRLNILYPFDPWDNNFIPGGTAIELPSWNDPMEWTISGPHGTEYVQAIVSEFPISPPDWPCYIRSVNGRDAISYDPALRDFWSGEDRLGYIETINRRITHDYWDWCATDLTSFQVRPRDWWININIYDPWPDIFWGEIYIGWPVGCRIFIDDVYVGRAPLRIPHHRYGSHVIKCYRGDKLVRRHVATVQPKSQYRHNTPVYRGHDVYKQGQVKVGRIGRPEKVDKKPVAVHKADPRQTKVYRKADPVIPKRVDTRANAEQNRTNRKVEVTRERTVTRSTTIDRTNSGSKVSKTVERKISTEAKVKKPSIVKRVFGSVAKVAARASKSVSEKTSVKSKAANKSNTSVSKSEKTVRTRTGSVGGSGKRDR